MEVNQAIKLADAQQDATQEPSQWADPTWSAMRRTRGISGACKLVWQAIFFGICEGKLPAEEVVITASVIAKEIGVDASNARQGILNLNACQLIKIVARDTRAGTFNVKLADPLVVAIARLAPRQDEQAELQLNGSCSPAAGDGSEATRAAAARGEDPAGPAADPRGDFTRQAGESAATTTSNPLDEINAKGTSNSKTDDGASTTGQEFEVLKVATQAAKSPAAAGEPQKIGSSIDLDRLTPSPVQRLQRIDELVAYQRRFVGDHVKSDRPLAAIAALVLDGKFRPDRLRDVLVSWKKQMQAGANHTCLDAGAYYLKCFECSARLCGLHVRIVHPSRPNR